MLLAHAIFAEGVRNAAAGASAVDLQRGLERGLRVAVDSLRALSRPVTSRVERAQVARSRRAQIGASARWAPTHGTAPSNCGVNEFVTIRSS